jgi:hypothetical protein
MSRTFRLSIIATMLLATTALSMMAYNVMNPPPPPEPPAKPEVKVEAPKPRPRIVRLMPLFKPADPNIGCIAEAKYVYGTSVLTDEQLHEYIGRHPQCLTVPVSMPMQVSTEMADYRRRQANLKQQIRDCETLSRMETLTPPGGRMTVLGSNLVHVEPVSRADACWKYAKIMQDALGN